jgi:CubicO group peptidase (beta-lactamase class C family)
MTSELSSVCSIGNERGHPMFGVCKSRFLCGVAAVLGAAGIAVAQAPAVPNPVTPASTIPQPLHAANPLTRENLEPWLDGIVPYALQRGDVAGAVVVVVKDGQVLLQKGYGYADVATKTPVSPDGTLFRTGSVGKLFTWTAVMQLVEQHKIELDRDVNDYLDFKIPPAFDKPITLRELMQHTAGFEEHAKHLFVDETRYQLSIEQYLKQSIPARIYPPGEVPAYSNYGATLAGYIVQRVSGEPYSQYIQRHIFAPSGMDHSSMQQPLPLDLAADMSQGYRLGSGLPQKFEIANVSPAGGGSNSGADMGRFMLAHLNNGQLGSAQILQPATAELMHRQSFQATPPLPGFALGFYHEDRNGHDVIAHEGDTNFFHSNLELLLDEHVGFFIGVNSLGKEGAGGVIRNAVFNNFADRYFPAPSAEPEPTLASAKRDGALLAGDYQLSRRVQTDLLDFIYLIGQTKIVMAPDDTLTVSGTTTIGGTTKRWREVAPFVWRDIDGHDRMAASVKDGVVKAVWFDETVPAFVLQRVPRAHDKNWILPLLGVALAILLIAALSWPLSAIARRRRGGTFAHGGSRAWSYRPVRVVAIANLVFVVGMVTTIIYTASKTTALDGTHDWIFRLFQAFGAVGLLGVIIGPWNLVEIWRDRPASWWARTMGVGLATALIATSVLGLMLHLLTISLNY